MFLLNNRTSEMFFSYMAHLGILSVFVFSGGFQSQIVLHTGSFILSMSKAK